MTQSPPTLIQALYTAFGQGDVPAVLSLFDAEIVWNEAENIPYADRNPYLGPQEVAEGVFGRIMADWDGFTVNPEKLVHEDDTVVALGRYRATHKVTGQPLNAQFVHVWTVEGGKVTRFQQYADTAQFLRVSGAVSPPVAAS